MLNWITEKFARADDSLATDAGLRAFLDSIPSRPALALDEIGDRIAGAADLGLDPAACRRALMRLDEAAQSPLEQAWDSLFGDALGQDIIDSVWQALVRYHNSLFTGYSYCLKQVPAPEEFEAKERPEVLTLATRAMAALVTHKALMRIRYRDLHSFWIDAYALYSRALQYDIADKPAKLYPGNTQQTTVEREYVTGLLLDVAPTGNLLPTQTHCLYLILKRLKEHYRLIDQYSPQAPFFIDPVKGKPPQRWLVGLTARQGMRFFGIGAAYKHLGALRKSARTEVMAPEWTQQSRIDTSRYRSLLRLMMEHWGQNPPQRGRRRDRQDASILITHGLSQIFRMLSYSKYAREGRQIKYYENSLRDPQLFKEFRFGSVEENAPEEAPEQPLPPMEVLQKFELAGDRELTETWSVSDMSEGGLGAIAEQHRGWLCAGMLLGYRYPDEVDWRIATVRRVGRTPQGKVTVGMKCFLEKVICARLKLDNVQKNENWIAAGTSADPFVDAIIVSGEQPTLIVPPGTYSRDCECVLKVGRSAQYIRLHKLVETATDYERISFSKSQKT